MKKIDVYGDNLSERGSVTTNRTYSFSGYNRNASPVYAEYETKFSIARGVFKDNEFTGRYVDENGICYQYMGNGFFAEA